jgi:hypothetical protein
MTRAGQSLRWVEITAGSRIDTHPINVITRSDTRPKNVITRSDDDYFCCGFAALGWMHTP